MNAINLVKASCIRFAEMEGKMTLRELKIGESGTVVSIEKKGMARRRILDMGLTPGATVRVIRVAPLGDPIEVNVRGYELSLRKEDASWITVCI